MNRSILELSNELAERGEVRLRFHTYDSAVEERILTVLGQALAEAQLNYLESIITTVLIELINNASKANLKRVYFLKNTKDIQNEADYRGLMHNFKERAVIRIAEYREILESEGMYIEFLIRHGSQGIDLNIRNNVEMTQEEEARVSDRIRNAAKISSMQEAFDLFASDEEGAGLGIALNIQLLRRAGIEAKHLKIHSSEGHTNSYLHIPFHIRKAENLDLIHRRIQEEIQSIPTYSEDIQSILVQLRSEDRDLLSYVQVLESDPILCAEILKEANLLSPPDQFFDSMTQATEFLGRTGVLRVLSTVSTRKILESRYDDFYRFWRMSIACAFYARELPFELNLKVNVDRLYLGGMFHNLGKMMLYSLLPEMSQSLAGTTIEEIQMGVSHAQIGSSIAEKWGYPGELVSLIKNFPRPLSSPEDLRLDAIILHISEFLVRKKENQDKFTYLDLHATNTIGIKDKEFLEDLERKLDLKFQALYGKEIRLPE